ncbi:ArnT family glycosyltransferase [Arthrobacter sp. TMS2-4]
MSGSPQRIDDEGTYVAQAWAVTHLGELAHYTYWYDHPPLGWIQLAAYTELTGAFERWDTAVMAGREAVLVATLISTALCWLLARRIGLSRTAATGAALLFALSPLALQFHRTVYLDNIATPWLLGALILAMSRKHQLAEFVGAAVLFGVAVLTKETYLLALPLVAFVMYRSAWPATRRYTLSVATSVLVLVGAGYILFAAVKGELFPGQDRVSLFEGIAFQLTSRDPSGPVTDPESMTSRTLAMWWQLDPVFIVAGISAAVVGLFIRNLRPFAVLLLALIVVMLRPGGYLPVPYIIMLLPFAALLVAGVTGWALARVRRGTAGGRFGAGAVLLALTLAAAIAAPLWTAQLRGLLFSDLDEPGVQAQDWVETNIPQSARLIVDDAMWVDLVESGFERENVIWYYKMDTDEDVMRASPNGWQDADYIITTTSMRTSPEQFPEVDGALTNSEVMASFGTGPQRVDVRRIYPDGTETLGEETARMYAGRAAVGVELAQNPALELDEEAEAQLSSGQVDARVVAALSRRAAIDESLSVSFPSVEGEDGSLRRQVLVTAANGAPLDPGTPEAEAHETWFEGLGGSFAAESATRTEDGVLVTFSIAAHRSVLTLP